MTSLLDHIKPKSDQLNADDFLAGPRVITIRKVESRAAGAEQPVAIYFDGDDGKPWRPCKTMTRLLVAAWGSDPACYTGRSVRLRHDPEVTYGGMKVGGIRIAALSDIESRMVVAVSQSRAKRVPYAVEVLPRAAPRTAQAQAQGGQREPEATPEQRAAKALEAIRSATDKGVALPDAARKRVGKLMEDLEAAGLNALKADIVDALASMDERAAIAGGAG